MNKALIYHPCKSAKLDYVLAFVFEEQLGIAYQQLVSVEEFSATSATIKINYSEEQLGANMQLPDKGYFSEFSKEYVPEFEKMVSFDKEGRANADIFAAVFFLLSRVEEYQNQDRDIHDRYKSKNSFLTRKGLLQIPVVDRWIEQIRAEIQNKIGLELPDNKSYSFQSTIDIDHLYAYKEKGIINWMCSMLRDLFLLRWSRLQVRFLKKDPYDRLGDMMRWHKDRGLELLCFVLTSKKGKYDKSLAPKHPKFITNVQRLIEAFEVGIHPSYRSNHNSEKIESEKRQLERVTETSISNSRQHFLRLRFPQTYRSLIAAGLKADFSMGYSDQLGFRAGTSQPFYWYDIEADKKTELKIHPFQIMDVTLKQNLKLTPEQAVAKSKAIIDEIKSTKGTCCIIWHNSSFYKNEGWVEGWEQAYQNILSYAEA